MSLQIWQALLTSKPKTNGQAISNPLIPEPRSDITHTVRIGGWLLALGLGGFLIWASFAPLDEGIPASGIITVDTKRKTIQHLVGGLVEKVLVHEGQSINAGDILVKLDDAQARAEYESIRHRYLSLRTMEDRLQTEQRRQGKITFHPDVINNQGDPLIAQHIDAQKQLLSSRQVTLRSELDAMNQAIQSQQEAAQGFAAQLESRKQQQAFLNEERTGLRDLVKEGYAPRNKLLELERMGADIEATTSELLANLARAKRSTAELSLRKTQREQEFYREVDTQLAEIRREASADEQRFKAASDALGRTEIKAPVSGSVVGIAIQTVGGVIPAGSRIMDIVPKDEALKLEAHLPPNLIDQVRVGQVADIRFSTFADSPQLVIEGQLDSVSADLLTDPATNMSYYLARITVTPNGLKTLGNRSLQPGMPVEIVIKTGERSLLAYLMHPLTRRLAQSMKEH